jgi:DNA-binding CsgD family transcriptional regulator
MKRISEIIERRTTPGILIFDLKNRLHYCNKEALQMIPGLRNASRKGKGWTIPVPLEISRLCRELKRRGEGDAQDPGADSHSTVLQSDGRPPYSMRAFFLGRDEKQKPTHIMVLIEKIAEKHATDFEKVRTEFQLSARELEVLQLICEGLANKEISERLFISVYTVKDHIKRIMRKMEVASRSQIITSLK